MVQTEQELPGLENSQEIFLDFETKSGDPKRGGDSPYLGDRIAGIAITVDENPLSWYVPIRHKSGNIPLEATIEWLQGIISSCTDWVNHNVLFDAHFAEMDGIDVTCNLVDTLTEAKLHDSDRFTYGLKILCREWLGLPMEEQIKLKSYLQGIGSKDFADAPADILGEYACEDVHSNRLLYRYLVEHRPEQVIGVWNTEKELSKVLYEIEKFGMPVHEQELKIEQLKSLKKQVAMNNEIVAITGMEVNPDSPADMQDLIMNQFGLPIISRNPPTKKMMSEGKQGNPSFGGDSIEAYLMHPAVIEKPEVGRCLKLLSDYRHESHFFGLFLGPYMKLRGPDGRLHPSYNQCVRTGRMSCRKPNAQQLNKRAKKLIHPLEGWSILSADYSQVEFRLIVHYIQDQAAILAYRENPFTDFHSWVAEICEMPRKPAKTMNFLMGYGGGKAKAISRMSGDANIIELVNNEIDSKISKGEFLAEDRVRLFADICEKRGLEAYENYHERLPGIKSSTWKASRVCKRRGFVFNAYGRRRNLPSKASWRAFNAIVQSCAADLMKERVVALANSRVMIENDIHIFALVHDEAAMMGPSEKMHDPRIQKEILKILESPSVEFRVPIICDMGLSDTDWCEASSDDAKIER